MNIKEEKRRMEPKPKIKTTNGKFKGCQYCFPTIAKRYTDFVFLRRKLKENKHSAILPYDI